ncbi:MAG: efflux RND transporter periplasmic adaptor subunit [Lachnospiraceae bacterium]|nr:efflux RND transporter periplasmic adaptor subunit [Lachnospiraceae bacterium]
MSRKKSVNKTITKPENIVDEIAEATEDYAEVGSNDASDKGNKKKRRRNSKKGGSFFKRHKKLIILIIALIVIAAVLIFFWLRSRAASGGNNSGIPDSTLLTKMDLELTVTATGTLQSVTTGSVTSSLSYKIVKLNVKEGDEVSAGDLLCVLDSSELDEKIESLNKDITKAQSSDYKERTRLKEKIQEAKDIQASDYERNNKEVETTGADLNSAKSELNTINTKSDTAKKAILERLKTITFSAYPDVAADDTLLSQILSIDTAQRLNDEGKFNNYNTQYSINMLDKVKQDAALSWLLSDYDAAQKEVNSATEKVSQAQSAYDKAVQTRDSTYESDGRNITSAQQSYDDAVAKDSAESLKTQLEEYEKQLEDLEIYAPQGGTITSMTAKLGETPGGGSTGGTTGASALFTIEDLDRLEIPVSVAEYDSIGIVNGMEATVTSNAFEDEQWDAKVTSVSPTATDGNFTVIVEITSDLGGLKAGMSTTVDIIKDSRQDVYAVPYDAVVTNAAGESVVYAITIGGASTANQSQSGDGTSENTTYAQGDMPQRGNSERTSYTSGDMPEGQSGGGATFVSGDGSEGPSFSSGDEGGATGGPTFSSGDMPEGATGGRGTFGGANAGTSGDSTQIAYTTQEIVVETGLETDYYIEISGDGLRDGLLIMNDPLGTSTSSGTSGNTETMMNFGGGGIRTNGGGGGGTVTFPSGGGPQ